MFTFVLLLQPCVLVFEQPPPPAKSAGFMSLPLSEGGLPAGVTLDKTGLWRAPVRVQCCFPGEFPMQSTDITCSCVLFLQGRASTITSGKDFV